MTLWGLGLLYALLREMIVWLEEAIFVLGREVNIVKKYAFKLANLLFTVPERLEALIKLYWGNGSEGLGMKLHIYGDGLLL